MQENWSAVDTRSRYSKNACSPAAVALAWVQAQPGVASTIIGVRRVAQLDQNLAALEVALTSADLTALAAVSEPVLNFPAGMLKFVGMFTQGGLTVNGATAPTWPAAPRDDADRY